MGIKFDLNYELDPMHFYVEFLVRVEGQYVTSGRVRFEIFSNGTFKGLTFQKDEKNKEKKRSCLVTSRQTLEFLWWVPFADSIKPRELVNKQFVADLSKYYI